MNTSTDRGAHSSASFNTWVTALAKQHARRLARIARREGLEGVDALDAVQDTLFTFATHENARALIGDEDGSSRMLTTMLRNTARNARRRHHRVRPHDGWDDDAPAALDGTSTDEIVARAELHAQLGGCLATLSLVQRSVVKLRVFEELSGDEVAAQLAIDSSHVAVLLYRAKKSLAECMGAR